MAYTGIRWLPLVLALLLGACGPRGPSAAEIVAGLDLAAQARSLIVAQGDPAALTVPAGLAGVWVGGGEAARVAAAVGGLGETALPPLVLADLDGGLGGTIVGGTEFPRLRAIAASEGDVRRAAGLIAREARAVGINAGVMRLPDLGGGEEATLESAMSAGLAESLAGARTAAAREGVQLLIQAFWTAEPEGTELVWDRARLDAVDLPLLAGAAEGGAPILLGAAHLPALTVEPVPLPLSGAGVLGVLRRDLGMEGVVAADLRPGAGLVGPGGEGAGEVAVRAVGAGVDLLLGVENVEAVVRALFDAVQAERLPAARLADAATRVAELRQRLRGGPAPAAPEALADRLRRPDAVELARELAARTALPVAGAPGPGWLPPEGAGALLLTPAGSGSTLAAELIARFPRLQHLDLLPGVDPADLAARLTGVSHVVFAEPAAGGGLAGGTGPAAPPGAVVPGADAGAAAAAGRGGGVGQGGVAADVAPTAGPARGVVPAGLAHRTPRAATAPAGASARPVAGAGTRAAGTPVGAAARAAGPESVAAASFAPGESPAGLVSRVDGAGAAAEVDVAGAEPERAAAPRATAPGALRGTVLAAIGALPVAPRWLEVRFVPATAPAAWLAELALVVFGSGPESQAAAAAVLAGELAPVERARTRVPPAPTLRTLDPAAAGMSAAGLEAVDAVIQREIARGTFPGAALAIGRSSGVVRLRGYGVTGAPNGGPIDPRTTVWDVASLTKVVATASAVKLLVDAGALTLEDPVSRWIPGFRGDGKDAVTVGHLLTHTSGLPPGLFLFRSARSPVQALEQVIAQPLRRAPGERAEYSDLGMILLGEVVARAAGISMDRFLAAALFTPLRMASTSYLPPIDLQPRVVPTAPRSERGYPIGGEVHDGNAFRLGGVAGHAGLFSTARDLAVYSQMMLNRGGYGAFQIFAPATVSAFTTRVPGADTRAYGWDTPGPTSSAGRFFGPRAFGHTGFTGTSIWIDPDLDLFVVLLTNRTFTNASTADMFRVRVAVHEAAAQAITDRPVRPR